MERRIAAVLAADMVGYSRLMEADETGTIERQKRHRIELIDPKIDVHKLKHVHSCETVRNIIRTGKITVVFQSE